MTRERIEKAAKEAVQNHFQCNGKYPCEERDYCEFCNGHNSAFDCKEDCTADSFSEGFFSGANWRISSVWHTDVYSGNTRRAILVRFNNGLFNVFEDIRDLKGIEDLVGMFAYLDDLIPERKEETV